MLTTSEVFGICPDGQEARLYTLRNENGMCAQVSDYGAILVKLSVPDREGRTEDVVLGYDSLEPYFENSSFFGATVGPNANRVGGAAFAIDGVTFKLDKNDGENNLHSHYALGYHKRLWAAKEGDSSVTFSLSDTDGKLGFPGNRSFTVTYSLSEDNKLTLHYTGTSDVKTLINFTNHTYFNLNGHDSGSIEGHSLLLKASAYTPVVAGAIPTGEIASVKGTPMDFTTAAVIGSRIREPFEQLELTGGYDHNWVIDDWNGEMRMFAEVKADRSSRTLRAYTDLPGVQFYAGNCIDPVTGKNGAVYGKRSGLCLETQFYPDTANKPQFPSAVFGPDRKYAYTTVYEFV